MCINTENISLLKKFISLFMDKSDKLHSFHTNSTKFISNSDINPNKIKTLNTTVNLNQEIVIERPQVLSTVLKHQIDSLSDDLQLYKEKYSLSEFQKLQTENQI